MSTEVQTDHQPLEERITYCEHLVDTLNGVVTDLQKRVFALELQNRKLLMEIKQQQEASRAFGMADEKPPHY
ncbi:MAG TPA: SlyX family protein [Kiritimatiellia bacterium]|nr:SlyX family protein [Kiritimatiellia bacterium]